MGIQGNLIDYIKQYKPTAEKKLHIGRRYDGDTREKNGLGLVDLSGDLTVSRKHALVWHENNAYWIEDLASTNNTYVNGEPIRGKGKVKIGEHDEIIIGLYKFTLKETQDLNKESALQLAGVRKVIKNKGKNRTILQKIFLDIKKGDFVNIMGPSGCGKSTLLKIMCGELSSTDGVVKIHGQEITANWKFIKRKLGYVPQENIIHEQLTVMEEMKYSARLRMGDDVSEQARETKIKEVLATLNITAHANTKIANLSGGQKKRICIAVELLINPSILFLDEPTSPLDPETIDDFLKCVADLNKNEGTTIIMVTHKIDDLEYADKVIFLAKDGYHAYFGKTGSALVQYFEDVNSIRDIYVTLSKKPERWYKKYYSLVSSPTKSPHPTFRSIRRSPQKNESAIKQYISLTSRTFVEKSKDKKNLLLMFLVIPLAIPCFVYITNSSVYVAVLFWSAVVAIFVGIFNTGEEIIGEAHVYKRERMFNLRILTYIFSKLTVFTIIALIQAFIFTIVLFFFYSVIDSDKEIVLTNFGAYYLYIALIISSASLLGLLISSIAQSVKAVMNIMSIILIVQIVFSGVIAPIESPGIEKCSYFMLSRWGTEGLARIQSDNNSKYNVTDKYYYPCVNSDDKNDTTIYTAKGPVNYYIVKKTSTKSVFTSISRMAKDTFNLSENSLVPFSTKEKKDIKIDPIVELNYDGNSKLDNWFNSLKHNILAIMILNLLCFIALFFTMKKKDTI